MLYKILEFLDGKKAPILAVSSAIISYLVAGKVIEASLGALFQTIISILGGGAVYASNRLGVGKRV